MTAFDRAHVTSTTLWLTDRSISTHTFHTGRRMSERNRDDSPTVRAVQSPDSSGHLRLGHGSHSVSVPVGELVWRYSASGGPGGQHANTSNTRVELVFEIESSPTLPDGIKARLTAVHGPRIRVVVDTHRSQLRNRTEAMERLSDRVATSLTPQPKRRKTKPSRGSKERRLKAKRAQSEKKAGRRRSFDD